MNATARDFEFSPPPVKNWIDQVCEVKALCSTSELLAFTRYLEAGAEHNWEDETGVDAEDESDEETLVEATGAQPQPTPITAVAMAALEAEPD